VVSAVKLILGTFVLASAGFAAATTIGDAPPASAAAVGAERFLLRGTVSRVVDGDTLDVRLGNGKRERVRLIGIDTPEVGQCYFRQATLEARRLALGRRVRLVGDTSQAQRDRYSRLLAYVTLPDGRDFGRVLIRGGFGRVYIFARPFKRVPAYNAAELAAKEGRLGFWSACGVPPGTTGTTTTATTTVATTSTTTTTSSTTTTATTTTTTTSSNCHPSYPDFCIPSPPPDLDCGSAYLAGRKRFTVRHDVASADPHRFDGDKDGVGCES
jgi:micrococcal nuclease